MLINSFLKKRVIASIGGNFINAGNEGKIDALFLSFFLV